jgi:serine/threonine protein phosphatase PrpC
MNFVAGDQFIVIASDGVWEFLSNEEVSAIVMPHYLKNSAEKAAEALIKESIKRW